MAEVRLINNLKGILYYLDTPLMDFEIKDRELIKSVDLSQGKLYPWELAKLGVSYGSFVKFFQLEPCEKTVCFIASTSGLLAWIKWILIYTSKRIMGIII